MPNIHDLKESRFVTQHEVEPPVFVTISGYEQINVAVSGAEPEYRWCLNFQQLDKPMTLNSTNGQMIAAITGSEDFDDWIGKNIVLYRDPNISFGGRVVGGIRIRAPKEGYQPPIQTAPEPIQNEDPIPF